MFKIGIFILSFVRVGKKKQSFVYCDAIYWVTLAITKSKKSPANCGTFYIQNQEI